MSQTVFGKRKKLKPVAPVIVPEIKEPSPSNNGHKPVVKPQLKPDRLPPYSEEMERGVLGCILLSPVEAIGECIQRLAGKEAFYDLRHQLIYDTMVGMYLDREPVDTLTLYEKLKHNKHLDSTGGVSYLSEIQDKTPSSANLTYYTEVVNGHHLLRKMIQVCNTVSERAHSKPGDVLELLDEAERSVLSIRRPSASRVGIKQVMQSALDRIQKKYESQGAIIGLSTGFPDLDYFTDGLVSGELTVPAAFPGDGKTSLVMNLAEQVVLNLKEPVAVFSLEMASESLAVRLLCSVARLNVKDVSKGKMTEGDFERLTPAFVKLSACGLHLVENCDSVMQIVAEARRLKQAHGIKLIVVDYLQLVTGGGRGQDSNREQEVSGAAAALKRLAKELNVPILAPSQLTDDGKLRESRAIGQHADNVWKLEPEKESDEDKTNTGDAEAFKLVIMKNRNGPRGVTVNLTFMKKFTRFESAARVDTEEVTKGEPPPE